MAKKQTITPVLRILDVTRAREFYVDWLGFTIDWEHRFGENFPLYFQVSKGEIIIHLTEHYGDCIPGARIRILMPGLTAFHQQLKEYRYYKPCVEKKEWGTQEMSLIDPFGNHIDFIEDLEQ
jgi:catechol 2,3-dioxygenase-like lactoylglutathione lyase family enzyme